MKVKSYQSKFIQELGSIYDTQESNTIFFMLLQKLKGLARVDLALNPDIELVTEEVEQFNAYLKRLLEHEPIQYIIGKTHFYGLEFEVNSSVLIPRTETEDLINWIVEDYKYNSKIELLDIGTGSGCIAISLAKHLEASVSAIDVSDGALAVAKKNASNCNVNIDFIQKDILTTNTLEGKFDVIVSNPPYVRNLEKTEMRGNVLEHEPHLALFVEDTNPLIFYDKIARLALQSLKEGGKLYFEINQYLPEEMKKLLVDLGYKDVTLKKDIYDNYRMISGTK
ncbi:MAG: peptide chain release factor N(5)-glutamine methyltransferase [Flavobacteriales bacterium]|nr:peptide chain release factor N(5)-glutamine methyltransferase [Flavobacteriales bacterium]